MFVKHENLGMALMSIYGVMSNTSIKKNDLFLLVFESAYWEISIPEEFEWIGQWIENGWGQVIGVDWKLSSTK